jgi:hypothetical protein
MKMSPKDFIFPPNGATSTDNLLQDLQFLEGEGNAATNITSIFKGGSPQSGATASQYQEQVMRSLGAFRPVYKGEMTLLEEVAEIVGEIYADPTFLGSLASLPLLGRIGTRKRSRDFESNASGNLHYRDVQYDEMDVDVQYKVLNQADFKASATLRTQGRAVFLESLRHHPEMVKEADTEINFSAFLLRGMADMGEDLEAITRTPEEKQQRAQAQTARTAAGTAAASANSADR